jgi:hypothetical protein
LSFSKINLEMVWGHGEGEAMNHLTADQVWLDRLAGIVEPVEIRDPDGKVLGHYTPVLSREQEEFYARAAELFDVEEAERIAATEHGQGRPLREILERLEAGEPLE